MPEILINDQIYTDGDIEVLIGQCDAYRNKALELACELQIEKRWCTNSKQFDRESCPCGDIIDEVEQCLD